MRKVKFLTIMTIILSVFLSFTICVSAESMPVKDAWILYDDCIVVLRENGDLLLGKSLDTQTPKLLAQNVKEFKGKYETSTFGEHDRFTGIALHNNGDVSEILFTEYGKDNEKSTIRKIQANAEKIYFTTILTSFLGTTITFTISLPSIPDFVFGLSNATCFSSS